VLIDAITPCQVVVAGNPERFIDLRSRKIAFDRKVITLSTTRVAKHKIGLYSHTVG
jgi:hypothetical protein